MGERLSVASGEEMTLEQATDISRGLAQYFQHVANALDPKPKKKKKLRNPNVPKRPPGAYFLWVADNREKLKDENPESKGREFHRILGGTWNKLPDKKKEAYIHRAQRLKEKWVEEKENMKTAGEKETEDDNDDAEDGDGPEEDKEEEDKEEEDKEEEEEQLEEEIKEEPKPKKKAKKVRKKEKKDKPSKKRKQS
eukprot:1327552-Amorphochlora_amoeboformis.AAC.2